MKIQTMYELSVITKNLPFIFQVEEFFGIAQIYDGKLFEWDIKNGEFVNSYDINIPIRLDLLTLIDYFEEDTLPTIGTCQCDLYNVLMVTGCRCGGK